MADRRRVKQLEKQAELEDQESCLLCGWRPPEAGDRPGCADRHIYLDALPGDDDDDVIDARAAQAEAEAAQPCEECGRAASSAVVIITRIASPRPAEEPPDQPPA